MCLFPKGPSDPLFSNLLHLLLEISPYHCSEEILENQFSSNKREIQQQSQHEKSSNNNLFGKRISTNIELMAELRNLFASKQLTAISFAKSIMESCPPALGKLFAPLLDYHYQNNYSFTTDAVPKQSLHTVKIIGKYTILFLCKSIVLISVSFTF
jgi:hypothetical protein